MKKKLLIIFIFALSLFLRLYRLDKYPVGFLWDEAALGYNAYSILKTGRDEYGKFLPIIFKSFGDYKPGLYVYFAVPSVAIFGLNEFAVRFPSALLGAMSTVILYWLVKEMLLLESTRMGTQMNTNCFPLVSALLLAISPWHINFSRGAWEATIMIFLLVLGFYLLLKFLNTRKTGYFVFSITPLIISLFAYQASKMLMPVLVLAFIFFFRNYFGKISLKFKIIFILLVLASSILFNLFASLEGKNGRLKVMSIFSYPRSPEETQDLTSQDNHSKVDWALFHSAPFYYFRNVLDRYYSHFSGKFLFVTGDWSNPRSGIQFQGVMYYLDLLFLIAGAVFLIRKKRNQLDNFMIFWLFFAPLPSALTRDSISSIRSFSMVIPLIYITALGIASAESWFKKFKKTVSVVFYILISACYLLLLIRFLDLYFVHDKFYNSVSKLFGYKEMINFVNTQIQDKDKVVISDVYGQPYIYFLFYSKFDPRIYQKAVHLTENPYGDVGKIERIGKIEFRKIYWPKDRFTKNSLFAGDEFDLPIVDIAGQDNIYFLKEIKFPNGKTAFRIVETK